jgi:hypothetical protein
MKKRIISLILVLATLVLMLASCGAYSIANENIASFATFDADSKAKFDADLLNLVIKDGEFKNDATVRDNMTWDSIYNDLASAVSSDAEKKTTGVPASNSIVNYNYYYTYTETNSETGATTTYFFTDSMKSGSTTAIQLGLRAPSDFESQIIALFKEKDIKDYIYSTDISGEVKEGDVVFISYTYTYNVEVKDETTGEVATKPETVKVTNERLVLTRDSSAFVNHLLDKKANIGKDVEKFLDNENGRTYDSIKIAWRANGNEIGVANDVTYTEKYEVYDVSGIKRDLKDKELTYHVYPVNFIEIPEFNELNFINVILDDSITFRAITRVLFGEKFDEKTQEEKDAILNLYKTTEGEKELTLEALVTSLATAQKEYATALEAKEKAETDKNTKDAAVKTAQSNLDADPENADKKTALETAQANLTKAETALTTATETYNTKLTARDNKVNALLTVVKNNENKAEGRNNLADGYYELTYDYLRDKYNEEIRMNLAEAVYALFEKYVVVSETLPEKAIEVTFDRLMENYEYEFYNGTYNETTKETNYKHFGGSFKDFLKEKVTVTQGITVTSYDLAVAAVKQDAANYVKPILRIYALSDAYGVRVSDEDFENYKESEDGTYNADSFNYGENSTRYAYQFDKLMNYFLEYTEAEDGSYTYTRVKVNFEAED